jgi:hypothetical protein
VTDLTDLERTLRDRLEALDPRVRTELLNVLMTPDYERARRIGDLWLDPRSRTFVELLIDAEEDPPTRGPSPRRSDAPSGFPGGRSSPSRRPASPRVRPPSA